MHPVQASTFATLATYATAPFANCIARIAAGKASGTLLALGAIALSAKVANLAWNRKCTSKPEKAVSRSFALILTTIASYTAVRTITSPNTERNLLGLAAFGGVLFTAFRSIYARMSPNQKALQLDEDALAKQEAPVKTEVEDKQEAPAKTVADANVLAGQKAPTTTVNSAPTIAEKRAQQNLAKQQLKAEWKAFDKQLEQEQKLRDLRDLALLNLKRTEKLIAKQDQYKVKLLDQRQFLLELFFDYCCSEMKHKYTIRTFANPKSHILSAIQELLQFEDQLHQTQIWIQNSDLILRKSIEKANAYNLEIGGKPEEAEQFWKIKDPNAELRKQRLNQEPVDQKVAAAFKQVIDLWNLRLDNEIKTTSIPAQHRLFHIQEVAATKKLNELIKKKESVLAELQSLGPDSLSDQIKACQSRLSQVQNHLAQCEEQIKKISGSIKKSKRAYDNLIQEAKELDEKLKTASASYYQSIKPLTLKT